MSDKDKRRMILDAALELIREKGFEGTRIIDIADRAGIGKGTVYDYFSSKEEVIAASVQDVVDRDFRNIFDEVDQAEDFETKLRRFLEVHCKILDLYGPFMVLFADLQMKNQEDTSDEIKKVVDEIRILHALRMRDMVARGIETGELREGLDVDRTTTYILSVAIGFAFSYMLSMQECCREEGGGDRREEDPIPVGPMVDLILRGVRNEKEAAHD